MGHTHVTPRDTFLRYLEPAARGGHPGKRADAGAGRDGGEAACGCVPPLDALRRGLMAGRRGSPGSKLPSGKRERHPSVEPKCVAFEIWVGDCLSGNRQRLARGCESCSIRGPLGAWPGSPLGFPARSGQFGGPAWGQGQQPLSAASLLLFLSPFPAALIPDPGTTQTPAGQTANTRPWLLLRGDLVGPGGSSGCADGLGRPVFPRVCAAPHAFQPGLL